MQIPGWSGQFWAIYRPGFPIEIVIAIYYYILLGTVLVAAPAEAWVCCCCWLARIAGFKSRRGKGVRLL
jgi:hypothetical protein